MVKELAVLCSVHSMNRVFCHFLYCVSLLASVESFVDRGHCQTDWKPTLAFRIKSPYFSAKELGGPNKNVKLEQLSRIPGPVCIYCTVHSKVLLNFCRTCHFKARANLHAHSQTHTHAHTYIHTHARKHTHTQTHKHACRRTQNSHQGKSATLTFVKRPDTSS